MKISAGTDVGKMRQSNQDAYAIGELPDGSAWAVVCDGMGGHAGGHVASKMAVNTISGAIKSNYRNGMSLTSVKNMLESAVVAANADIYDSAAKDSELRGMGTTVVAALYTGGICVVAHVGDSRCYLISGKKISRVTKDHSLVQELLDAGVITETEAENHPRKNIITRALGIDDDVLVDFSDVSIAQGDMLLICTDGLTNHVSDKEITECVSDKNVFDYSARLIKLANENGGSDNITAVVMVN